MILYNWLSLIPQLKLEFLLICDHPLATTVADLVERGGVNFHKQGRSPCPRHEVPSGGRVREAGVPGKKIEIRKCLDDF